MRGELRRHLAGNTIGPQWLVTTAPSMQGAITDGKLVFTLSEELAWTILSSVEHFDASEAELLLEVDHFTALPHGTELNLVLTGEEAAARVAVCCGNAYAQTLHGDQRVTHDERPWTEQRYLRLRTADDTIAFELSHDGDQWAALATIPAPFDLSHAGIAIEASTWQAVTNPGYASVESVELFAPCQRRR